MLHLDYLAGQKEYRGFEYTLSRALVDLYNLQDGGIDGILIENWKEYTTTPEADPKNVECMLEISRELAKKSKVPLGISVLNNDYKAAFGISKEIGARFVQLDVYVDKVRSEFEFNPYTKEHPFDIIVNLKDVLKYKPENVALFVSIQPKHYILLEKNKPIELSAKQAIENKADAIIVTGEKTGIAPSLEKIRKVKQAVGNYPVGIGSGFSRRNAMDYLPEIDFVIVGTDLKYESRTDNPVDIERVRELMDIVRKFR
jgi:membrane complex biogenesis BtpA family protein